ncbi:phosphoenolpyruvate-protein phosphotransferase (PTS system, enzyme I) [Escherichia coli]|uniref:Phosphoenolpyruvate-protein phosphotransferase (PTS system, enzyme I) n=1 Tax=Escherichia coli TaxID=562 RepID=A0A377BXY4_ECOLX|nr:phosphoenolpyruvate-protein phosphotransferase (PTS system, enzyme I) [Escherichia coli]
MHKKKRRLFSIFTRTCFRTPGCVRELFAEVDKGSVAEWAVKTVIEKFAEQFAALSDNYLKERAGDLRALGQRLLFHLDDANQGPNAWPERFILVQMNCQRQLLLSCPRIA